MTNPRPGTPGPADPLADVAGELAQLDDVPLDDLPDAFQRIHDQLVQVLASTVDNADNDTGPR